MSFWGALRAKFLVVAAERPSSDKLSFTCGIPSFYRKQVQATIRLSGWANFIGASVFVRSNNSSVHGVVSNGVPDLLSFSTSLSYGSSALVVIQPSVGQGRGVGNIVPRVPLHRASMKAFPGDALALQETTSHHLYSQHGIRERALSYCAFAGGR